MGVSIIVDTNVFYCKRIQDFTTLTFMDKVEKLIDNIELNSYKNRVKVILPEIVLDELLEQQIEAYQKVCNDFFECKFPGYNGILSDMLSIEDYEKYIRQDLKGAIDELKYRNVKVEIASITEDFNFKKIVRRAIKKKPPFEGKDKMSDKGFKDAVLWEILLQYKEKDVNRNEKIVLYTNDKIFNKHEILEEFNKIFNEKLILANWNEKNNGIFNTLSDIFKIDSKLSKELEITTKFIEVNCKSKILELLYKINYEPKVNNQFYKILDIVSVYIEETGNVTKFLNSENKTLFKFNVSLSVILKLIKEDKYSSLELNLEQLSVDNMITSKFIDIEVFYDDDKKIFYVETVIVDNRLIHVNPIYIY
ncbi:TPA: DUF4935 domain-containing protein [Clostridioides difficile]|uniref:PIN domain-containing protein n=1 Tax=Clostridioides difficile TaxID=1496 RepID=UPI000D1F2690|nr:PIN domain-containing protein [Clostridioides difficile]MCP8363778.1 PIN domain-containing protein [Clostridioides difficile]MCP8371944.1 PIN domain-containing protein [Clostridioides difficile]MCP8383666.1 PIN domain-containing protein [Clostridioides difficile]NKN22287.1 DUF4935 domain-containing protein [Clostridioides difficile]VHX56760.1 Uncharacterised protein [Clostridioides difficile]